MENVTLPMFLYIGDGKWKNTVKQWNRDELDILFFSLQLTLDQVEDSQTREQIIYLLEKLFNITNAINIEEL